MMIRCVGLTKWYGSFLALDGLDLTLEAGDLFGFIGPNGAGKTTTMKILATLLLPTEGSAHVGGHDVIKEPDAVRHLVGYMPDFFGTYAEMRVSEYLAFFATAYRVPRDERNKVVAELLELVELTHKGEEVVGSLSRGMQQRLGLARALVHDPKVLILDEPASGLDPRARVEMREILKQLRGMGKTILLSSHILPELADVCNRIGVIAHGRLRAQGSIEEVSAQVAPPRIHVRAVMAEESEGEEESEEILSRYLAERFGERAEVSLSEDRALVRVAPGQGEELGPEEVAAAVVGLGFGLRYLEPVKPSLEEVFLHLTDSPEDEGEGTGDGD
ncbi:MAG: ABC transporter ATP-binding protein, partial [Myxococcota bacterium]